MITFEGPPLPMPAPSPADERARVLAALTPGGIPIVPVGAAVIAGLLGYRKVAIILGVTSGIAFVFNRQVRTK
jgi:hypothetical protein